jgi:MFS family permease
MWVVILGRAICGMGGGGIMTISSIIITGENSPVPELDDMLTVSRYCPPT